MKIFIFFRLFITYCSFGEIHAINIYEKPFCARFYRHRNQTDLLLDKGRLHIIDYVFLLYTI